LATSDVKKGNVWVMGDACIPIEQTKLSPIIQKTLSQLEITELFAVQRAVVPVVIAMTRSGSPGDICIGSPTGSGKTLAYTIPIQEILLDSRSTRLRALIMVPTRQLATQVYEVFRRFEPHTKRKCALLNGTSRFKKEQEDLLDKNGEWLADVAVGTPSRILQHIRETSGFTLEHLCFIVMDEVDILLSQESADTVRQVLRAYHEDPQVLRRRNRAELAPDVPLPVPYPYARKILCSATLTPHAGKIEEARLFRPQFFTYVSPNRGRDISTTDRYHEKKYAVPPTLRQHMVTYDANFKPLYLIALLLHPNLQMFAKNRRILCFVDKNSTAHRLHEMLSTAQRMGLLDPNAAIDNQYHYNNYERRAYDKHDHSYNNYDQSYYDYDQNYDSTEFSAIGPQAISAVFDSSQLKAQQRKKLIKQFEKGEFNILLCADVMGRGIDIEVDTVINYDAPTYLKTYIHRVGRTARAGKRGVAFTMLERDEVQHFRQRLERRVQMKEEITEYAVSGRSVDAMKDQYKELLQQFKAELFKKRKGKQQHHEGDNKKQSDDKVNQPSKKRSRSEY
jgi:ATP-dependent RNA helicase DDX51/DBP6